MEIDFPLVDHFRVVDIVAVVVVAVRIVAVRVVAVRVVAVRVVAVRVVAFRVVAVRVVAFRGVAVRVVAVCVVVRDVLSVLAKKIQLSIQYFHQPNFHQFFEIICHFFPKAFSC